MITPSIFVACLAAYNDGHLHGAWIDATQDPLQIHEEIQEMLDESPVEDAEEWAIHDKENFGDVEAAAQAMEHYQGSWASVVDYARDYMESCYEIPRWLEGYVDYRAMARDMEMGGDIVTVPRTDGRIHIFTNH